MNHVGDCANFINSIEHIDSFGSIWHTNCDAIAFFGTNRFECGSSLVDFFDEFLIGNLNIEIF